MEADFSGWATRAGLKCSDGRTIMPNAFQHQDQLEVPLVWQHGHDNPERILGHAVLENRAEGVYAHCYFNKTDKAAHAKELVSHGDIKMLSIWANELIERTGRVIHGVIREVSLVLSGANPGALIENVTIRHSSDPDDISVLEDEVFIRTGLEVDVPHETDPEPEEETQPEPEMALVHAGDNMPEDTGSDDETVEDVYNSMSQKQKDVLHFMIGEAIDSAESGSLEQGEEPEDGDIYIVDTDQFEGNAMAHNVFEQNEEITSPSTVLSHDAMEGIFTEAKRNGSLKEAVKDYALSHGITDIDIMFPDAKMIGTTPEFLQRRTEWVSVILGGVNKTPFSRIKTLSSDLTTEEARAKGYIKGNFKKEQFIKVSKRTTSPTTVYKKQKLDRDDMVDITDFNVVVWLKDEMRLMLDEEVARAILLGDGREVDDDDKIDEECIRPIATDHELYTTKVYVNIDDASSTVVEVLDAIIRNRKYYKGTGLPTLFTTETYIAEFLLLKDTLGRKIYRSLEEIASELRVSRIVAVEPMEDYDELVAVIINPSDYTVGATSGGEVNFFDDFDIDYNQHKYLVETRCSGAIVKLKAAISVLKVEAAKVLVIPAEPAFDSETGEVTITNQTGVVYKRGNGSVVNAAGSPYTVAAGTTETFTAEPASTHYFPSSEIDSWNFTAPEA